MSSLSLLSEVVISSLTWASGVLTLISPFTIEAFLLERISSTSAMSALLKRIWAISSAFCALAIGRRTYETPVDPDPQARQEVIESVLLDEPPTLVNPRPDISKSSVFSVISLVQVVTRVLISSLWTLACCCLNSISAAGSSLSMTAFSSTIFFSRRLFSSIRFSSCSILLLEVLSSLSILLTAFLLVTVWEVLVLTIYFSATLASLTTFSTSFLAARISPSYSVIDSFMASSMSLFLAFFSSVIWMIRLFSTMILCLRSISILYWAACSLVVVS